MSGPTGGPDPAELATRVTALRSLIATQSPHADRVTLVGVTKGFPAAAARALVAAGVVDLGENYAQELAGKQGAVPGARWHFLGPVQRNKVRALAPVVAWWHGLDRIEVGAAIARRSPSARVLVQVNLSADANRPGIGWDRLASLVDDLRRLDLDLRGLMGVASAGDRSLARSQFERLASAARDLELAELSMGMSDDLDEALAAGATMVRIGRGLLGERPQSPRTTE